MDKRETIVHELFILFWLSLVQFIILLAISLLNLEDTLFWPAILLTILGSIIQDHDAWPEETISISCQTIRVCTNICGCLASSILAALICSIDKDSIGWDSMKQGRTPKIYYECRYGAGGMALLLVGMSAFLASFTRSIITGCHLLWKIGRSVWLHFNDDDDDGL